MKLSTLPSTRASYWHESRAPRYSLTFALPLLALYEVLAAVLSGPAGGVRNGADVIIKSLFVAVLGRSGPLVFGFLLIVTLAVLVVRDSRKSGKPKAGVFGLMFGESLLLAAVFGFAVSLVTAQILSPLSPLALGAAPEFGPAVSLMVSLGAGLYEELLFRVIVVGALMWMGRRLMGWGSVASGTVAVVLGALVFSAFHYVGAFGDAFTADSFVFRTVAGLAFSGLYVLRGFGITAWTHALYDVFILVFGA